MNDYYFFLAFAKPHPTGPYTSVQGVGPGTGVQLVGPNQIVSARHLPRSNTPLTSTDPMLVVPREDASSGP
jgi:hypothetical protein